MAVDTEELVGPSSTKTVFCAARLSLTILTRPGSVKWAGLVIDHSDFEFRFVLLDRLFKDRRDGFIT